MIVRSVTLVVFFLLVNVNSFGQNTFFEFIDGWRASVGFERYNGYRVFGLGNDDNNPFTHYLLDSQIDLEGNSSSSSSLSVDSVLSTTLRISSQLTLEDDSGFYCIVELGNPGLADTTYCAVMRYTWELELWSMVSIVAVDLLNFPYCVIRRDHGGFIVALEISNNVGLNRLAVLSLNQSGNIINSRYEWAGSNSRSIPKQLLQLSNGDIAIMYDELNPSNAGSRTAVLVLDSLLQFKWSASPGDQQDFRIAPGGMVEQDGELLVAFTDPYYFDVDGDLLFNFESTIHFEKYDIEGSLLEEISWEGQIPNAFSDVFAGARHAVSQLQFIGDDMLISAYTSTQGLLIQTDWELGVDWFRAYTPHTFQENSVGQSTEIYHTLPTSDGGFLCTGMYLSDPGPIYPDGIQTAFALKVDEFGCLEEGCEGPIGIQEIQDSRIQGFKVWPNPVAVGGVLSVRLPSRVEVEQVEVFDVVGRFESLNVEFEPSNAQTIKLSHLNLSPGLYSILVTSRDGQRFSAKFIVE